MTVRIPDSVRRSLREKLWQQADELGWQNWTWFEKSPWYESWTKDPEVGGLLSRYMDQRRVRVYIKDTIMKGYVRSRQADAGGPFELLGIMGDTRQAIETWERPHGRRLLDGRVVVWGNAEDWKLVLMAVYERSFEVNGARPYAAVLLSADVGKFHQPQARHMVEEAGRRLGINRIVWSE